MLRVSEDGGRGQGPEAFMRSYRQLGHSLLDLQHAADQVFDAIALRISEERGKLTEISQRIQSAKAQIDQITVSKEAITIKSPSTYPLSSIIGKDFQPLFPYHDEGIGHEFPITLSVNGGLDRENGVDGTRELFQFFMEESAGNTPKDIQQKVTLNASHASDDIFLENLLPSSVYSNDSLLFMDSTTPNSLEPEEDSLPPAPPSLHPKNCKGN